MGRVIDDGETVRQYAADISMSSSSVWSKDHQNRIADNNYARLIGMNKRGVDLGDDSELTIKYVRLIGKSRS